MRKKIFYGSPNKRMDFIWSNEVAATFYTIANSLFMLEKKIKEGTFQNTVTIDYFLNLSDEKIKYISNLLNNLVLDVLCEDVKFKLIKKDLKKKTTLPDFKKNETLCLFSGGIDSTLGILECKKHYGSVLGLYVAHRDLGKITNKVGKIVKNILEE